MSVPWQRAAAAPHSAPSPWTLSVGARSSRSGSCIPGAAAHTPPPLLSSEFFLARSKHSVARRTCTQSRRPAGPELKFTGKPLLGERTALTGKMAIIAIILCSVAVAGEQLASLPQVECPEKAGVQAYPHPELCDQFYLCSNGTLTLERCQNGLLFKGGPGAAHHFCHYHWDVDCGARAVDLVPLSSDGCEYQFGLYTDAANACSGKYTRCEFGRPQLVDCPPGLAFDLTSHRCNWADQLEHMGCTAENVIDFRCPSTIPSDPVSARFWPYPRFAIEGDCEKLISCVNGHPRIVSCGEGMVVDDSTLTCEEPELVPSCQYARRKRQTSTWHASSLEDYTAA